jgi:hypothetical protein
MVSMAKKIYRGKEMFLRMILYGALKVEIALLKLNSIGLG